MRMVRWMCGVSLRERKTNVELRERLGIEKIGDVMRRSRPRMTWEKVVERDMKARGLERKDAEDRAKWRALSWGAKG